MAVRKLKGSWWVDFQYRGVRIRRRSVVNTRDGASALELELRSLVMRGGPLESNVTPLDRDQRSPSPTFMKFAAEWYEEYVRTNNSPSEQRAKRNALKNHLVPFLGETPIADINCRTVERLKAALAAKGLKNKSINNYLCVLHTCLACAVDWELLEDVPRIRRLKAPAPPVSFLSDDETARLLRSTPEGQLRSMIVLALHTGLRFCELVALRWIDVNFNARQIQVCRAEVRGVLGSTKSGNTRYVPISDAVLEMLLSLPRTAELIFHRNGRSVRYVRALEELHEACRRAGVPMSSWHVFRHTFASTLVARGVPLAVIRDLLGHSTVKMTERYAHLNAVPMHHAISVLNETSAPVSTWRQPAPWHGSNAAAVALTNGMIPAQPSENATGR